MDEMKIKVHKGFMKGIISSVISKVIRKKIGIDIDVIINTIEIESENGKLKAHIDLNASFDERNLIRATKLIEEM